MSSNSYTFSSWVKLTPQTPNTVALFFGATASNHDTSLIYAQKLGQSITYQIKNITRTNGIMSSNNGGEIDLDSWHYITTVLDNQTNTISHYIDGVLAISSPLNETWQGVDVVAIGSYFGYFNFIGMLDNTCMFDKALNVSEVDSLYLLDGDCKSL